MSRMQGGGQTHPSYHHMQAAGWVRGQAGAELGQVSGSSQPDTNPEIGFFAMRRCEKNFGS